MTSLGDRKSRVHIKDPTREELGLHGLLRHIGWVALSVVVIVMVLNLAGILTRSQAVRTGAIPTAFLFGCEILFAIKTKEIWLRSYRIQLESSPFLFLLRLCVSIVLFVLLVCISAGIVS